MLLISLGEFCLPAIAVEQLGLRSQSTPLDWVYSDYENNYKFLQELIANEDVTQVVEKFTTCNDKVCPEHLQYIYRVDVLPKCNEYLHMFPHDTIGTTEYVEKYTKRCKRFRDLLVSNEHIMYICCNRFDDQSSEMYDNIMTLLAANNPNSYLLVINRMKEMKCTHPQIIHKYCDWGQGTKNLDLVAQYDEIYREELKQCIINVYNQLVLEEAKKKFVNDITSTLPLPIVSVVIPTYNRYSYLIEAIKSVQAQTYFLTGGQIELIVVDDCSTQTEYQDLQTLFPNLKYIRLPQNTKQTFGWACSAYVRNMGIQAATGKYVAFLDDDDIWVPTKIEKQVLALESNPDCELSSTEGYNKNERGHINLYLTLYLKHSGKYPLPNKWTGDVVKQQNMFITSSVMATLRLIQKVGGFQLMPNTHAEDYDCWKRCLQHTQSLYLNEPLFIYDLQHGNGRQW